MHLHPQRESTLVCLHRWVKHSRDDDFLYAVAAVFVLQTDCSALRRYGFFFFLFFFFFWSRFIVLHCVEQVFHGRSMRECSTTCWLWNLLVR